MLNILERYRERGFVLTEADRRDRQDCRLQQDEATGAPYANSNYDADSLCPAGVYF